MNEKVLILEDLDHIKKLLCSYLEQDNYTVFSASDGREGLKIFNEVKPNLVITDVVMPYMDGFSVCRAIKSDEQTRLTPVVLLTSLDDNESYIKGMESGADDFLVKPVNKFLFLARVKALLKVKRLNDRLDNSWSLLFSLAKAVEAKDKYTENHTNRVGDISKQFGMTMGLSPEMCDSLYKAGVLHDIGKIGIPDSILNKADKLTDEERKKIEEHTIIGRDICKPLNSMKDILEVVYCHHEKWDGTGYPSGLKGNDIPLMAQIVSIVDVFDAITSDRPYRPAFSKEEVKDILLEESGKSFNPELIDFFINKILDNISEYRQAI
jgi:putative two-component system response regulator